MWRKIFRRKQKVREIFPDEILLDARNMPDFNKDQFEGEFDKPITLNTIRMVGALSFLILALFLFKSWNLEIGNGGHFAKLSEQNRLRNTPIFATRGVIYDRNGIPLAWNESASSLNDDVPKRVYIDDKSTSHLLGYVQYPTKDSSGFYYREDFIGISGIEKALDNQIRGKNGVNIIETDVSNKIVSANTINKAQSGQNINLSIDFEINKALYNAISDVVNRAGFAGGAGVITDVNTGEVMALVNYPSFDSNIMSYGTDSKLIHSWINDKNKPFLNRAIDGLYTPGSIVKTIIAFGALEEKIISPDKQIVSEGLISVPNDYDPKIFSIFRDWKAHGPTDMRHALSVSSDVYFYSIGGGYKEQDGLGISRIDKYMLLFGIGEKVDQILSLNSPKGVIPTPEWKQKTFNESWRLGNTYHTSIGQYGFQVSPLHMVRAVSAIATKGKLINPVFIKDEVGSLFRNIEAEENTWKVLHEGMRLAVTEGTAKSLFTSNVEVAAKSGTAELGVSKENVNSWMIGFFPYENPKYAFAVVLEKGSVHNLVGSGVAFRQFLDWVAINRPDFLKN